MRASGRWSWASRCIAYIVGWPHRFKHLARALKHIVSRADERVWFTTAGEIAKCAEQLPIRHSALKGIGYGIAQW